jgi:hypothetical protein
MAQVGPLSHLVGMTKYKRKRKYMSSTAGNNHGRAAKLTTYCPFCPPTSPADPEQHPHAVVSKHSTKAACPKGHMWKISTRAYSDDRYQVNEVV